MLYITFNVYKQKIKRTDTQQIVSDSRNYLHAAITFSDDDWIGIKTAVFKNGDVVKHAVLDDNNECLVPWEVIKPGILHVSVFCGDLITADTATVYINESGYEDGGIPEDPSPTVYEQIIAMLNEIETGGIPDDKIAAAVEKYLSEHPVETLTEEDVQRIVSEYVAAHKEELKGEKGDTGNTPNFTIGTVETLPSGNQATATITGDKENPVLNLGIPKGVDGGKDSSVLYRWKFVEGSVYPCKRYNVSTNSLQDGSTSNVCVYYNGISGIQKLKLSACALGSSNNVAWSFLDESRNVLNYPQWESGKQYKDVVIDVPENAASIYVNGNNYVSPHIEIAVVDEMSDGTTLPYLLNDFARKISYRDNFAWKAMDKGYIALTFDDSLGDIDDVYNIAHEKGVPVCFGAIPEKLLCPVNDTQTVCDIMRLAVADGGEVLAHGSSETEIVTAENIDDLNFLYKKFVVNKQKLRDFGFDVRGNVRVGGSGNICNDARTDVWQRLLFDYGDLYGIAEPYNHARGSFSNDTAMFEAIDKAIANHEFLPILFHTMPSNLGDIIDYIINNGGAIVNYATVYDTFGSTVEKVEIEKRLKAIESIQNGNEVKY